MQINFVFILLDRYGKADPGRNRNFLIACFLSRLFAAGSLRQG